MMMEVEVMVMMMVTMMVTMMMMAMVVGVMVVEVKVGFLLYRLDDAFLPPYLLGVSMLVLF